MSNQGFTTSVQDRYFEDYQVGLSDEFGSLTVEETEVIAYGRRFDPQPFHTDPAAAEQSVFGGLIASGWHTAGLDDAPAGRTLPLTDDQSRFTWD